jgi:lipoprotein-anchoring transpeptidase ErfK/SrfK
VRRHAPFALLATALVVLAVGAGVAIASAGDQEPQRVDVVASRFEFAGTGDATAIRPEPQPAPIHGFRAAEALVPLLEAFPAPGAAPGTPPSATLPNPTRDHRLLVVGILDTDPTGQWHYAQLPQRPNGSTGWIRASDVRVFDVANRIEITVSTNQLRVLRGDSDEVLFEATVATGTPETPTPLGEYFIDIWNPLGQHPVYGWGQLSVSGFSEVLHSFGGGIGQIAIHGWNNDSVMGRHVSNGCIRMRNPDIARVAELTGLGTPVRIVA